MTTARALNEGFSPSRITWLRFAGITSLFAYALFWLMDIEISVTAESLIVLFFVIALFTDRPKVLLSEPIPYLLVAWIIFQIGVYHWSSGVFPELKSDHIREARILTNVFLFVIVAWWLGGDTKRVVTVIVLCAIGYLIGATFQEHGLLDEMWKFKKYSRLKLGYINWEHASVYSTFVFLSLLTLQKRITSYIPAKLKVLTKVLIYLALIYSAIAIIGTQTRATWLGLLVTGGFFTIGYIAYKFLRRKNTESDDSDSNKAINIRALWGLIFIFIGIIAVASTFQAQKLITKRLHAENDVIGQVLEGHTEQVRISSVGIRIKIWQKGYEWFKEKPITGWGPQSRKALFLKSDLPMRITNHIRHLHNSYIDLLIDYGVVGLALFAGLFIYIWFRAWQAWKGNIIPNDIMLFATLWTVYWLVVNCFESYVIYSATGNYINAIMAGILYTYHLQKRQAEHP